MKKLFFSVVFLLCVGVTMAQQLQSSSHSKGFAIDVAFGAGYTRLGYAAQNPAANLDASIVGGFGWEGHLGLDFFFSEYVGIGIGADLSRYAGGTQLEGALSWTDVTDTDKERYTHTLQIPQWKETQQLTYIEPELLLLASIPAGGVYVSIGAGVKYSQAFASSYKASGELTHTGYYDKWDLTLSNVDAHGFYTEKNFTPQGALKTRPSNLFLVGKIGVLVPLTQGLDLQLHAIGAYSVMKGDRVGSNQPVGFRNDRQGMQEAHYFMEDYQSLTLTSATKGFYRPMMVGLEIGVRYTIPFKQHKKGGACNCMNDDTWYW